MEDKHYTPEELQKLIERLQELTEDLIMHEYDYMSDEGKLSLDEIAYLLNLNIL